MVAIVAGPSRNWVSLDASMPGHVIGLRAMQGVWEMRLRPDAVDRAHPVPVREFYQHVGGQEYHRDAMYLFHVMTCVGDPSGRSSSLGAKPRR